MPSYCPSLDLQHFKAFFLPAPQLLSSLCPSLPSCHQNGSSQPKAGILVFQIPQWPSLHNKLTLCFLPCLLSLGHLVPTCYGCFNMPSSPKPLCLCTCCSSTWKAPNPSFILSSTFLGAQILSPRPTLGLLLTLLYSVKPPLKQMSRLSSYRNYLFPRPNSKLP